MRGESFSAAHARAATNNGAISRLKVACMHTHLSGVELMSVILVMKLAALIKRPACYGQYEKA